MQPPYKLLVRSFNISFQGSLYNVTCMNCNLTSCVSTWNKGKNILVLSQPPHIMLPSNLSELWYDDPGTQALIEIRNELSSWRAVGLIIAWLVAAISILITTVTAAMALSQTIHTAQYVNQLAYNTSQTLKTQESIDVKIES